MRKFEQVPIAHIFKDDLVRLENSECAATVWSIEMGHPDKGETVPLYLRVDYVDDLVSALENITTAAIRYRLEESDMVVEEAREALAKARGNINEGGRHG